MRWGKKKGRLTEKKQHRSKREESGAEEKKVAKGSAPQKQTKPRGKGPLMEEKKTSQQRGKKRNLSKGCRLKEIQLKNMPPWGKKVAALYGGTERG